MVSAHLDLHTTHNIPMSNISVSYICYSLSFTFRNNCKIIKTLWCRLKPPNLLSKHLVLAYLEPIQSIFIFDQLLPLNSLTKKNVLEQFTTLPIVYTCAITGYFWGLFTYSKTTYSKASNFLK